MMSMTSSRSTAPSSTDPKRAVYLRDDYVDPADRLRPHQQPGAAPTLGWLLIGVIFTVLFAWALPDLVVWIHSWSAR